MPNMAIMLKNTTIQNRKNRTYKFNKKSNFFSGSFKLMESQMKPKKEQWFNSNNLVKIRQKS